MTAPPEAAAARWGSRRVWWYEAGGFADTPVLRLTEGGVAGELQGPLLIELPDTVVVVRPGQRARFGELGSLVIEL
jgi:N-methylhydantoinase A